MKTLATALTLAATPLLAEPVEWTLDKGHAHIRWEVDHMDLARTAGGSTASTAPP